MPPESEKTIFDYLAIWTPIIIAIGALFVSWLAYKKTEDTIKDNFINNLRDKVKTAKHKIIDLENKPYTQDDKMSVIETIQDLLFYQGYRDEKKKFLSQYLQDELSRLQENIEDNVALILNQKDALLNKNYAKSSLNSFLTQL